MVVAAPGLAAPFWLPWRFARGRRCCINRSGSDRRDRGGCCGIGGITGIGIDSVSASSAATSGGSADISSVIAENSISGRQIDDVDLASSASGDSTASRSSRGDVVSSVPVQPR